MTSSPSLSVFTHGGHASRRDILSIGTLGPLGLSLFNNLGADRGWGGISRVPAKSCILIWLDGGPSHLETFDPKPEVSAEVRGPFQTIATNVPGMHICELMPRTATVCDKLTIIRSMTSPLGEHGLANRYLLTGYKPSPVLEYPSFGSVVADRRGVESILPSYIAIPEAGHAQAGFLGATRNPFETGGDPSKSDFRVRDLQLFPGIDVDRMQRRREFLDEFDQVQRRIDKQSHSSNSPFEQAFRLATSSEAKRAFELDKEPDAVRQRYGMRTLGQSCLLARRLVERGVSFVTIYNTGWDTHQDMVLRLRDGYSGAKVGVGLIPILDQALAALIDDLSASGLLDETLVLVMGEFGRTPKLNTLGGRDHWPRVFSLAMAGGGVRGGQVIGQSDRHGESPFENPITPNDLARTIYTLMGIDSNDEFHTADGRPVPINQGGRFLSELT